MCGISGLIGRRDPREGEVLVARMSAALAHRGPDDHGLYSAATSQGSIALGHRRLSIIDLSSAGHQPMVNPETGDVIVYNGELYNFRALKAELEGRGVSFRSQSDTEVILHAFARWGTECFARLNGMYALAFWDARRERLILARDPVGVKPLYVATVEGGLAFASEVRALVASGVVDATLDEAAVASYLAFGSVQAPRTPYRSVRSVPPGTFLEVDPEGTVRREARHFRRGGSRR